MNFCHCALSLLSAVIERRVSERELSLNFKSCFDEKHHELSVSDTILLSSQNPAGTVHEQSRYNFVEVFRFSREVRIC